MCYCTPEKKTPCCGPSCCRLVGGCAFCQPSVRSTVVQAPPPEVRDIVEWLRSDRFRGWANVEEIANMIEKGDACLDGMTPWDARRRAKRRAALFTRPGATTDTKGPAK